MFSYYHCIWTIFIIIVFVYSVLTSILHSNISKRRRSCVASVFVFHICVVFLSPVSWLPLHPRSPLSWYYRVKIEQFHVFPRDFYMEIYFKFFFLMVLPWGYRSPSFWKIMSIMEFPRFRLMKSWSFDWKKKEFEVLEGIPKMKKYQVQKYHFSAVIVHIHHIIYCYFVKCDSKSFIKSL